MVYVIHVQDDVQCGYLLWDYYISDDVRLAILGGVENARTYDSRSDAEKVVGRMREKYSNIASDTTINIEEYIKQEGERMKEGGKFPVFNPATGFCPICGTPVTVELNPTEPMRKIDCKSCGRISTFTVEIDWDWNKRVIE